MVECKVFIFILIFLLSVFFVIFIKLSNVETIEERMLFNDFIENYNKTYKIGSEEYETRFKTFQVINPMLNMYTLNQWIYFFFHIN